MNNTILVFISDPIWTLKAMHIACANTRNTQSQLILIDLRLSKNIGLLGMGIGWDTPTTHEYYALREYHMIAEDYGIQINIQPVEYESFYDITVQLVDSFTPKIIFAQPPKSYFQFISRFTYWHLRHHLARVGCKLYTLEDGNNPNTYPSGFGIPVTK